MRCLVLVIGLALTAELSALTLHPMSFTELVDGSAVVVYGRVADVRGQWTGDRRGIESILSIDAIEYFKGELGGRLSVRVPGGQAGTRVSVIPGAPRFDEGDLVVLFLKTSGPSIPTITGFTQGVFRVTVDPETRAAMVVPPPLDLAAARPSARGALDRRPISMPAFAASVREAVGGVR